MIIFRKFHQILKPFVELTRNNPDIDTVKRFKGPIFYKWATPIATSAQPLLLLYNSLVKQKLKSRLIGWLATLLKEIVGSVDLGRTWRVGAVKTDGCDTRTLCRSGRERRRRKRRVSVPVTVSAVRARGRTARRAGIAGHVGAAQCVAVRRRSEHRRRRRKRRKPMRRCCVAVQTAVCSHWTAADITRLPIHKHQHTFRGALVSVW